MLRVVDVDLPSPIPIVGCEITPYVFVVTMDDIPETHLRYRWYRIQDANATPKCIVHPLEPAAIQCNGCVKIKAFTVSFHCSSDCFFNSWRRHRMLHEWAAMSRRRHGSKAEEKFRSLAADVFVDAALLSNGCIPVLVAERSGDGQVCYEVGWKRKYIPSTDDVGHVLEFECTVVDSTTGESVSVLTLWTVCVIPSPLPTPRRMIPLSFVDRSLNFDPDRHTTAAGKFTILTYNVLADFYAEEVGSSFCPPWALSWTHRRQNLLREIVGYRADILCLQEVAVNIV